MRLWSIQPKYLDTKGLVAVWREGLLAKKVLEERTIGYKNHPQLVRFKKSNDPVKMINKYLHSIISEANLRNYKFDESKINKVNSNEDELIEVTVGQIQYEFELLKWKMQQRDLGKYNEIIDVVTIEVNSIFKIIDGDIEKWESVIPIIQERTKVK